MKAYSYTVKVYDGILSITHGTPSNQERLFVPKKFDIGWRDKIDFYADDLELRNENQIAMDTKEFNCTFKESLPVTNIKEIEVDGSIVNNLMFLGEALNKAEEKFQGYCKEIIKTL